MFYPLITLMDYHFSTIFSAQEICQCDQTFLIRLRARISIYRLIDITKWTMKKENVSRSDNWLIDLNSVSV